MAVAMADWTVRTDDTATPVRDRPIVRWADPRLLRSVRAIGGYDVRKPDLSWRALAQRLLSYR